MRRLLLILVVLVAVVAGAWIVGYMQPLEHTATYSAVVPAGVDAVWQRIADVQAQPSWRKGLTVEPAPTQNGLPCWKETMSKMAMLMCVQASTPPKLREVALSSPGQFRGTWTYQLEPVSATQTRINMTESVIMDHPSWRFFMLVAGPNFLSRQVTKQLAASFGGKAVPVR